MSEIRECPPNTEISNCAYAGAKFIVDNELVVVDFIASQMRESGCYIQADAEEATRSFRFQGVRAEDLADIADLGCLTCGKCVQIVDDLGELEVRFG